MSRLLRRIFLIIFVSLLILCGVMVHNLNQSMNELDTALDQLELSLTELEMVLDTEHE